MAAKQLTEFTLTKNQKLSGNFFRLELKSPKKLAAILPGQFCELQIPGNREVYLRRPFSIHNIEGNSLQLLIKIAGRGTESLEKLPPGTKVSLVYPLGREFTLEKNKKVLLIGGGCGVAPLYLLAKNLAAKKCQVEMIYGARTKPEVVLTKEFKAVARLIPVTEDGSLGQSGLATEALAKLNLAEYARCYACGPEPMLKAIWPLIKKSGATLEVSLEGRMGCGIGACLCCVTKTKSEGNLCVCTEGPVFNAERLAW